MPSITMPPIVTPCIKVCVLEPQTGLCRGCGRNGDEIARWGAMPDAERRRIMALLPERMTRLQTAAPAR
ncbi:MAG: DUF1289 domain-containing protein [Pseudorhodoplanes sp.]|nr:DUF1289 domain-containing protein [Pseudorhodoplanes sp.]GIK81757.1 MAG: Fe-S oxidoreductase [Alphaproteobacteria bacterium]